MKIKYSNCTQVTRARTVASGVSSVEEIVETASALLAIVHTFKRPVRLLGVTLSALNNEMNEDTPQMDLGL